MSLSRRRFITITAAAAIFPKQLLATEMPVRHWTGHAMGAQASLSVAGLDKGEFIRLAAFVAAEIERLEDIFSLYRTDSSLVRLNTKGVLENPPLEFVQLLSLAGSIHRASDAAFDPTIQPLWRLYSQTSGKPQHGAIAGAQRLTGWNKVRFDSSMISYARPGMAMTLNGIAQGYATDRVADLLRRHGMKDVLVSVGEIAALGRPGPGRSWRIGIAEKEDGVPEETVFLKNMAIATSAPSGMVFDTDRNIGHIINARTGTPTARWRRISVINPSAAIADGLSTAFCAMEKQQIIDTLQHYPGSRLIAMDVEGNRFTLSRYRMFN